MSVLRPVRWSHTFLDLVYKCPAAAQAKLRGNPSVVPPNVRSGSDLHQGIQRHAVGCWERGVSKDTALMERIAAGYDTETANSLRAFARDARWPWRKLQAADVAECPVEQMWEADLPNGEHFVGRIDLAIVEKGAAKDNPFAEGDDVVRIVDWKQGRPLAWNDADAPDQLLGYALLYRYNHPEQQDYELLYGAPGWQGKWAFKAWQVTRLELDRFERELVGRIDRALADEEWAAQPGDACAGCFFSAACPLRGTETFAVLTGCDPDELALAKAWHAAKATEATKYLKAIEKANGGPFIAHGVPWGWNQETKLQSVMDREALDEHLRSKGHGIEELETDRAFDKRRVAAAKKAGWLEDGLLVDAPGGRSFGQMKHASEEEGEPE